MQDFSGDFACFFRKIGLEEIKYVFNAIPDSDLKPGYGLAPAPTKTDSMCSDMAVPPAVQYASAKAERRAQFVWKASNGPSESQFANRELATS